MQKVSDAVVVGLLGIGLVLMVFGPAVAIITKVERASFFSQAILVIGLGVMALGPVAGVVFSCLRKRRLRMQLKEPA